MSTYVIVKNSLLDYIIEDIIDLNDIFKINNDLIKAQIDYSIALKMWKNRND